MPRTREQFNEMKDDRKSSILKAALPLFSLNSKVSIDAICEKAKCSHGIIYHYYRNSDQVLQTLLKSDTYLKLKANLLNDREASSYEKIEDIMGILLDVSLKQFENICYLNMIIKDREKGSLFAYLVKLVKEAQISGLVVAGDPPQLVESVFFLLKGLYLTFLLEKHPVVRVPSVETVMQLLRKSTNFSRQIL